VYHGLPAVDGLWVIEYVVDIYVTIVFICVPYMARSTYLRHWNQKALEIYEKVLGLEHSYTIITNKNIAIVKDLLN